MTNEELKARELVERVYELRRSELRVSPSWLATEVMQMLDPSRSSHPLEYAMAHLQFRQLARAAFSGRWEKETSDRAADQHDLFPELQKRYPIGNRSEGQEPEYVLLEHMTDEDIAFNCARLRSEALAKLSHADALEAWGKSRKAAA
jgi:hypothetical protein